MPRIRQGALRNLFGNRSLQVWPEVTEQNMKKMLPFLAVALIAGCSAHQSNPVAPVVPTAASPPAAPMVTVTPPTVTVTAAPVPAPAPAPQAVSQCSDDDLSVISGTMQSADTQRHVALSFINVSSHPCTLVGYPGADLVTPVGGVLINVPRRPAAAAHRLTLAPNDVANADVQSYAIDTTTGNDCARWGTLVVTPPNAFRSHPLNVDLPICGASVSSVD
jgi:Protein of unknown function (DUF4232)